MCIQRALRSFPAYISPSNQSLLMRGSCFSREWVVNGLFGIGLTGCFGTLNFGNACGGGMRQAACVVNDSCLGQASKDPLKDGRLRAAGRRMPDDLAGAVAR